MSQERDSVAAALERAADTAEAAARDQQDAAAVAREAARGRAGEARADTPELSEAMPTVLHLLGRSTQRLAAVLGALRRAYARALADENLSIRQIGARLGVSHQRVSTLLARHRGDTTGPGAQ